jgi:hypothetical protein
MQHESKSLELQKIIQNIKGIYDSTNLLEILTEFERVLENLDMYAFPNWRLGELAEGPISSRHWVSATFIWPTKLPPDPLFIDRMTSNGIDCKVRRSVMILPKKVEDYDDFKPGTFYPKKSKHPIWVVEIYIPKYMMDNLESGYMDMASQDVDLNDLTSAYEEDLNNEGIVDNGVDKNYNE